MQTVRNEVAKQTRAIAGVFAPAMKMLGIKRAASFDRAEPAFPVDILSRAFLVDVVVPFAAGSVAAVVALAPDESTDFSAVDELGAFMPAGGGATLGADL